MVRPTKELLFVAKLFRVAWDGWLALSLPLSLLLGLPQPGCHIPAVSHGAYCWQKLIPREVNWLLSQLSHVAQDKGSPLAVTHIFRAALTVSPHAVLCLWCASWQPEGDVHCAGRQDNRTGKGQVWGWELRAIERGFIWDTKMHWKAMCLKEISNLEWKV